MRALAFAIALSLSQPLVAMAGGTIDDALPHAQSGLQRFDAGDYAGAIADFERAEAIFHAPTHVSFMAQAHEKLGHLLRARALYQRLSEEQLPPGASPAFTEAQEAARAALSALDVRIPTVEVSVVGPAREQTELSVDGQARPEWWRAPIALDPGDHSLTASADGHAPASQTVTLAEGERDQVRLVLARRVADDEAPSTTSEPSLLPAWIAFGVGGAGLILGGITGGLSFAKVGELDEACPTKRCDPADQGLADEARTLGTISTVGFIVGGVGVAAGVVLLFWHPFEGDADSGVAIGPGMLAWKGSF